MKLGSLSEKYEFNDNPGIVSAGWDGGDGLYCGALSGNTGSVKRFISYLKERKHYCGIILEKHQPGNREFSIAWQFCNNNYDDFRDLQYDYLECFYYQPAIAALRKVYFNIENHHEVMWDVVWSRAVQYGSGYIVKIFEDACRLLGHPNLSYVDAPQFDAEMIKSVYLSVCKTPEWTKGPPIIREALYARFENEYKNALERLE